MNFKVLLLFLILFNNFIFSQDETPKSNEETSSQSSSSNTDESKKENDSNQGKNREERKLVVSLSYNASAELRVEYNLNSRFTIGSHFFKDYLRETKENRLVGYTTYQHAEFYNRRGADLYGKFFLFTEGPVYLVLGAGKYLDGGATRNTLLFTRNPTSQVLTTEAISNSTTVNPYWYAKYGVGLQWIFDFGLLLNLEASSLVPIHPSRKSYTYVDERNFISNNYYTPANLYFIDKYLQTKDPNSSGLLQFNLWIGYAFAI
ncbi:MAG TPA: hypothetical protein PK079_08375 [Leptospiraceae bacterium]|nr:hypothetical protein [Leptospiraceae bacterium]HMW04387.1 hypothetical protein [Leptospiraceae bacterium]HMX31043.1 hypothetical protein [Leptospiraceae bacterium]HMY34137.1 hypothetical protein [Leptospiraceae bacterium]HMZ63848.1 hypothetical protein [Leptospiraceae bacterium]